MAAVVPYVFKAVIGTVISRAISGGSGGSATGGDGGAAATEARRVAENKERTDQRRRAGFNQTQGAGLSGASSILGG